MDIYAMRSADVVMLFSGKATYEEGIAFLKAKMETLYGIEACRARAEADGFCGASDSGCLEWAVVCWIEEEAGAKRLN